ncbi:B3 domain-containing protein At1g49475-like [Nicotiana tabacum]|uniref:B3 domain-containing protein At1g49475-like n=2 Tax=Nicotiana TaxID=4085 RepID=A0A1S4B430_TOBAC|nr:PREDICTED: B3 domain-containing protein At1g49475-like [Nicotiana tabacum]
MEQRVLSTLIGVSVSKRADLLSSLVTIRSRPMSPDEGIDFSHCSLNKQNFDITSSHKEQTAETAERRLPEEPKPVDSPETPPQFFKVILSPHASKLHIPDEFVMEYGVDLRDVVSLEVPDGAMWKVKLQNCSGMAWLKEGWNRFKEYYSIGCGYFLLFRYNGNSHFSVFIFDLSASEIDYPPGPNEDEISPGLNEDLTPEISPGPNENLAPENLCVVAEPEENPLTCQENSCAETLLMISQPSRPNV